MKWLKGLFVGIVLGFIVLCTIANLDAGYHGAADLERHFLENEEKYREAAEVLSDIAQRTDIPERFGWALAICRYDMSSKEEAFTEQVGSLYFNTYTSYAPYLQEEYTKMYDAVVDLFSSEDVYTIAVGAEQIKFYNDEDYGVVYNIICAEDKTKIYVPMDIREQLEICDGWYAVVSSD